MNYTLDLNAGLTQVLADGTNTYLYGNGRIAQASSITEYFLDDALGSVRQLADPAGAVTLTQSYAPYGEITQSVGVSQTSYAFTGEKRDANGLTYLRARYYAPQDGRFISRDTWDGVYERPLSLNRWNYTEGNPVNLTDPSGYHVACDMTGRGCDTSEFTPAQLIVYYREKVEPHETFLTSSIPLSNAIEKFLLRHPNYNPVEDFREYHMYVSPHDERSVFNKIRGRYWSMRLVHAGVCNERWIGCVPRDSTDLSRYYDYNERFNKVVFDISYISATDIVSDISGIAAGYVGIVDVPFSEKGIRIIQGLDNTNTLLSIRASYKKDEAGFWLSVIGFIPHASPFAACASLSRNFGEAFVETEYVPPVSR